MGIAIWWLDTSHGVYICIYIYIWYTHKQQQTWEYKYKMTHNWGDDMDTIDGHGGDFTAFPCADSIRFQQWSINLGLTVIMLTWRFHSVDCPVFVFKILTQQQWSKITMEFSQRVTSTFCLGRACFSKDCKVGGGTGGGGLELHRCQHGLGGCWC